jgi:hypothetical protein
LAVKAALLPQRLAVPAGVVVAVTELGVTSNGAEVDDVDEPLQVTMQRK